MKAPDAHSLLLTCQAPQKALTEFGDAVARGRISGTASVLYLETGHVGEFAKIQRYWLRIEEQAQQAAVWTWGRAELASHGENPAIRLSEIEFDEVAVASFVAERKPSKPKRGKKRIQDDWTPFWLAAIQLAKAGRLNAGYFPTKKALHDRLHVMMGATMDLQSITPLSSVIYEEVLEPTAVEVEQAVAETD
ncbi:hypothetical protein [Qipengyuania sp. JC766]|uniref:hypothetical protein n=1 Tax=Qipengyuania sp. JC766 TaxID=3232139 RepID=UPI0034577ED9